ncbi:glucose-6-phosphate isomerase [Atopobacter sp. AH10]|uniref:glucose-6-phosphate isomerase n=1 Tax=Atopobacter sp. AH10 TaxID=2315861 RepID=UPI000EF211CD|nr:glucose-6-phosphate isomerase [Atopobacter sp. AH10]RLK62779.1 glucose-6-phosphate isomerase [Atopobacter sp. AH10]
MSIKFDSRNVESFIKDSEVEQLQTQVTAIDQMIREKTGAGNDFLGWLDWPYAYDKEEFERIKKAAKKIQEESDFLVVIGIGGSYLGARAVIEFLSHSFAAQLPDERRTTPRVLFAGNSISSTYLYDLLDVIGDKDFSINVISKSGTTTEPALAFRVLKEKLVAKYGEEEAKSRIYATTDRKRGALKSEADKMGYESFVIPDAIGGRFTVLTAVGLLPIAVAGGDIDALMSGAQASYDRYQSPSLKENDAYRYAIMRNILYRKGRVTELLINYEPRLAYFSEWWKQLFGESEGKDQKGIYPSSANFSTDLHSLGQYIQEGLRNQFETVLWVKEPLHDIQVPSLEEDVDGLKYLEGRKMSEVNQKAQLGTTLAHVDGQVPNFKIQIDKMDAYSLGELIYFFELAVAMSGYLNGVNPFDQPGVEAYKKNMFALLGKPGFEELGQELNARLLD